MSEYVELEPLCYDPSRTTGEAANGSIRLSGSRFSAFHPTLPSPVSGATKLAAEIAASPLHSPAVLRSLIRSLESIACDYQRDHWALIEALRAGEGSDWEALEVLYRVDQQKLAQLDTGQAALLNR